MFMFPLSFSSSSSLSSIPPSLDTISELERVLSDISEDDAQAEDAPAPDSQWTQSEFDHYLPHVADPNPPRDLEDAECCEVETCERRWFCLKKRIEYFYYLLCFLVVMGRKIHVMSKVLGAASKKIFPAEKFKAFAADVSKVITDNFCASKKFMALNWNVLVAYLTLHLPSTLLTWASALPWVQTRLHLPALTSSTLAPVLYSLPPFASSVLSSHLSSYFLLSPTLLTASLHQYLLNPSPLFLPALLVVFLLLVMLTATQSLALALVLAAPLGLTLFYMESVIPRRRRAVLPLFATERESEAGYDERDFSEYLMSQSRPQTWGPEMCDPAA